MIRSYIKVALRSFRKHKGYSLINVLGLAVGIAVCALILLWVRDELSYDRFHAKADRIHRALWHARYGDNEWTLAKTPVPLGDVLKDQFPEVESVVRFTPAPRTLRLGQEWINEDRILQVEPSFTDVFTVEFLAGNPTTALSAPGNVVLTEETSRRYFGDRDPIGETIEANNGEVLKIAAVVRSFPEQSHFQFDFLLPLDVSLFPEWRRTSWAMPPVYTYFVVSEVGQEVAVAKKLQEYVNTVVQTGGEFKEGDNFYRLPFQSLTDIHLRSEADLELSPNGNIVYVYVFSIIGLFILLLACVNFINLATARAANRSLEVGVRKVLGSQRSQLIRQFLAESFVYVGFALLLAVLLMEASMPVFNAFAGKSLSTDYLGSPFTAVMLVCIAAAVTLLAGAYPAFVLSAFRPIGALKGSATVKHGRNWLRSGLVVAQFCISIALIAGTLIVRSQLDYVQSKQLGFDKEHVLVVEGTGILGDQYAAFQERLRSHPMVVASSATTSLPGHGFDSMVFAPEQPARYTESSVNYTIVDEGYADVLGLKIVAGRNFSPDRPADASAYLINEAAADAIGWENPIGKTLTRGGTPGEVIGVVENFHYESLHTEIEPLILPYLQWTPSTVAVRLAPGNTADGVAAVRAIWDEFIPQRPFAYSFLDQNYDALYQSEQKVARVFSVFSGLALFIACLGLFGLASYVALQRTKEIGIRKVLGASSASITVLLTREFALFVLVAFLVAVPLAYFGMSRWLESFAYRITPGADVFLISGTAVLAIALLTVSYQAIKAAMADPVRSLRYE